jgi:hypothetical protein
MYEKQKLLVPPGGTRVVEIRAALLWVEEDGILRILIKPACIARLKDAEELHAAALSLVGRAKTPVLADYHDKDDLPASAVAFLVESSLSRTIGNFFLGLGRFTIPARLFTSVADAIAWLKSTGEPG